jgi:hypothetical protein
MVAATLLYNGDVGETAAIIAALSTNPAANLIVIPQANGLQVSIYLQGS